MLGLGMDRNLRAFRSNKGPMALILRSLCNPFAQNFFLLLGDRFPAVEGRHVFVIVLRQENSGNHFALLHVAFYDCGKTRLTRLEGMALEIQPEPALSFLPIRPMAMKAAIRQDRTNITIKLELSLSLGKGYAKTEKKKQMGEFHGHNFIQTKMESFAIPTPLTCKT